MRRADPSELHVIVNTHITRHLRRVLLGVAWQEKPADSVTVTCDGDDPGLRRLVGEVSREAGMAIRHVQRAHAGVPRVAQARNNGVRALLEDGPDPRSVLVFLDGDSVPAHDAFAKYRLSAARGELIIGGRAFVEENELEVFDEKVLREGREPVAGVIERQMPDLRRRRRRYRRQRIEQFIPLWGKPQKPRPVGCNHGVWLDALRAINGFDERFEGWGREDDDLGRRIYRSGGRPVIAVDEIVVYHLYHPEQRKDDEATLRTAAIYKQPFRARCEFGLENPRPQPPVDVAWVKPD